jgi:hypothetical protein
MPFDPLDVIFATVDEMISHLYASCVAATVGSDLHAIIYSREAAAARSVVKTSSTRSKPL